MKCGSCGEAVTEGAVWCTSCGARVSPDAPPVEAPPAGENLVATTAPGEPAAVAFDAPGTPKTEPSSGPLASKAPPKQAPLGPGTVIDKKYEIVRVLGEGGMGIVYLAQDIHSGIEVVLKAMRPELAHRRDVRDRTLAEGRTLARIDHPNVVHLNAIVADETGLWLVMQYIEGESLDKTIRRYKGQNHFVSFTVAMDIFRQIVEGVGAAHRDGVIHRDLKPANVLVRRKDGVAKVTDFGIAKPEEQARVGQGNTKGVIGSLWYMSPEQVQGRRDLDKRLDIYGLGILLYELLTGQVPFNAESSYEVMRLHVETPMPRVLDKRKDVPPWVDRVIARACAKKREDRYGSCEEFLADLDRELGGPMRPVAGATRVLPGGYHPEPTQDDDSRGAKPAEAPAPATKASAPPKKADSEAPRPSHAVTGGAADDAARAGAVELQPKPRLGLWIGLGVLLVALGGVAVASIVMNAQSSKPKPKSTASASSASEDTSAGPSADASAPTKPGTSVPTPDPLAALVGAWRSEGGTDFAAVRVGETIEFRIVDPKQLAPADYAENEARFTLRAGGEAGAFRVEEKMRPLFSHPFDPKSRTTCQEIWTEVDGKPLLATKDGEDLRVDFARATFKDSMAVVKDGVVVRCESLRGAVAGRGRTVLKRAAEN